MFYRLNIWHISTATYIFPPSISPLQYEPTYQKIYDYNLLDSRFSSFSSLYSSRLPRACSSLRFVDAEIFNFGFKKKFAANLRGKAHPLDAPIHHSAISSWLDIRKYWKQSEKYLTQIFFLLKSRSSTSALRMRVRFRSRECGSGMESDQKLQLRCPKWVLPITQYLGMHVRYRFN